MTSPSQRIAIVGLGMALRPHLKSLHDLSHRVELAAAWSPSEQRRQQAHAEHSLPIAESLESILEDASIQSVLLLTPPLTHLDLVRRCAAAGKHVLLEKPVDVSVPRARQAVETMDAAQRRFGIVLQHRFRPASQRLRQMIRSGELGRLISASASIKWWRDAAYYATPGRGMKDRDGGGVLLTQAIHTLDLFLDLAGPVSSVTAHAVNSGLRRVDTEDVVAGALRFTDGAIGTLDATTTAYPGFPERIELVFDRATAMLSGEVLEVHFHDGRSLREGTPPGEIDRSDPMAFDHGAHRALISDFLDAVEQGRPPAASGESALAVQKLIEALLLSSETQGPVDLASR